MPSPIGLRSTSVAAVLGLAMLGWSVAKAPAAAARGFKQVNLVADTLGMAAHTDPDLLNPWGMTFDSAQKGPLTVADNHAGVATAYDPTGQPAGTAVAIPAAAGSAMGAPTGVVFNSTTDFHGDTFISAGNAFTLDGLWELLFGGGGSAGDPHKLYFTSGPDDENHGLFGSLEVARGGK